MYGASFLALSAVFIIMQRHILVAKQRLLHDSLTAEVRRSVLRKNAAGLVPYAIATAGGLITPYLTLALCGALAVFYALPATTADLRRGR